MWQIMGWNSFTGVTSLHSMSNEEIRFILKMPSLTDEEVERIRDDIYALAEIILEMYQKSRASRKLGNVETSELSPQCEVLP